MQVHGSSQWLLFSIVLLLIEAIALLGLFTVPFDVGYLVVVLSSTVLAVDNRPITLLSAGSTFIYPILDK
jgi:hypothetical protein